MAYVADLHLHSSYARGTSPSLSLETLTAGAAVKGIDLLATADFTHPAWLMELKAKLAPVGDGLLALRTAPQAGRVPRFILGTEVSCVYEQGGRTRRVHLLLYAPDFQAVDRLCAALGRYGALESDGRPMLGLSSRDCVKLALECDERCEVIAAHVWTPWYSAYGSKGGFDSLEECFGDMLPQIHAVETGLSSDPAMNWSVPELEGRAIVSFSDAHSTPHMGRELTVFEGEPSYEGFRSALRRQRIARTIEFYPEEGKYHYDGHRKCGVCQHPSVSRESAGRCPKCHRRLTLGVLNRVQSIATGVARTEQAPDGLILDPTERRPPFRRLVPLEELVAESMGRGVATKGVRQVYHRILGAMSNELYTLESATFDELEPVAGERIATAVLRARSGQVSVHPGCDGVYGKVRVWELEPSAARNGVVGNGKEG